MFSSAQLARKYFYHLQHDYGAHGIRVTDAAMDVPRMIARKDGIVKKLTGGVTQLFTGNKGGTLEIVAHFPEGSVSITNFSEVDTE